MQMSSSFSLALIVKWLTFPPQIRAGFSAPLVEMLMVLPTQFNVNPILLFSLLGRSSLSLFPYTAAGGTDRRLTPPSGSGESAQDRKRRRNRRRVEEDPLVHAGVFLGGVQWMQTLKLGFASAEFHLVLKGFNNNRSCPHTRGEWQVFVVYFSPILFYPPFSFLFSPTGHWVEIAWDQIESTHSGNLSEAMYHLLWC